MLKQKFHEIQYQKVNGVVSQRKEYNGNCGNCLYCTSVLACLALYRKLKPHGDRTLPVGQLTSVVLLLVGPLRLQPVFYTYTDQKENLFFLIYMEIQSGAVAKSYMRKGFLIYEEMRQYFPI
jgi:hypothetical protein